MKFCEVFNGKHKGSVTIDHALIKVRALQHSIKSGIGFNYHSLYTNLTGRILSKEMSKAAMTESCSRVGAPKIYYGGKGGKGKRIDIEMASPTYIFKLNLR